MKREHDIQQRLRATEMLSEAISAMKSLSVHHFREARAAVTSANVYRMGIDALMGKTGASLPAGKGAAGLLIIGTDLGLCGDYNRALVSVATKQRLTLGIGPTFCVGRRTQALLAQHDTDADHSYPSTTSTRGITALLLTLAQDILTLYVTEELSSFDVVASRFEGVGASPAKVLRLLPIAFESQDNLAAAHYVPSATLATVAVREYLYITLHGLLLDALASEYGARLAATQSAEDWLAQRIDRLRHVLISARRESSTQEVIEIAAGARVQRRREWG